VLSNDPTASNNDIVVAGSVTHTGTLAVGESYTGRATITLPRDLVGTYYVIVRTNSNQTVTENGRTANNVASSVGTLTVTLAATADLTVSDVTGPQALRPGDTATVNYVASNKGTADAISAWRDRIYLVDSNGTRHEIQPAQYTDTHCRRQRHPHGQSGRTLVVCPRRLSLAG
jgi:hypothetical protein